MKLDVVSLLVLIPLSAASFLHSLQQSLSFWRASKIPTFILDTHHPWLEQHRNSIERLENPAQSLCDLHSDLRSPQGSSALTYPSNLFDHIEIDNNKAGVNRPGWDNAMQRLTEILACPAALHDVKHFKVEIYDDGPIDANSTAKLPSLFVQALSSMSQLQKLDWNTFGRQSEVFREAFLKAQLELPTVRHLMTTLFAEYVVGICPGVEQLEASRSNFVDSWRRIYDSDAYLNLFDATRSAQNLTNFRMNGYWNPHYLEILLDARPSITALSIRGGLTSGPSFEVDGQVLEEYLTILAQFPHLRDLSLPDSSELHLGFDGGPWCGNAYFGKDGRRYGRLVSQEDAETTQLAGLMVTSRLPQLENLSIGRSRANITRNEDGRAKITWPWTGRMEEWTYEMWPEPENPDEDESEIW